MARWLGWLIGLENVASSDQVEPSLAAPWAADEFGTFWVVLALVAVIVLALTFYLRFENRGTRGLRIALGVTRGLLLGLLVLTLADPVLRLTVTNVQPPSVFVVFDGSESMAIADPLPDRERAAYEQACGLQPLGDPSDASAAQRSRLDFVQGLLRRDDKNLLEQLAADQRVRIQPFVFDGNSTSQLRKLTTHPEGGRSFDPDHVAEQLSARGQVTALGSILDEAAQQHGTGKLAGVVLFSDFVNNAGPSPLNAAQRLNVPLYTVGIGAVEALDVAVELDTGSRWNTMKRAERTTLGVKLRSTGLQGQPANVSVVARRMGGEVGSDSPAEIVVGQRTVMLNAEVENVTFPFTPQEAGRFEFEARVEPLPGETIDQNNRATREITVTDDYLRLMYVAYEPTWEWRFIKEVFHRDKLVGLQGFRTFLSSSDARVRQSNTLFLPTLTPKRSEFFANDVIFLDDMPQSAIGNRFAEMLNEYVGKLGGGLVVISGPRFGPRELPPTIRDMLPVIVDANAKPKDEREFAPQLTPDAQRYDFMRLGDNDADNAQGWKNLGSLSWYQPVAGVPDRTTVLLEHPTDTCADGKRRQPLVAIRQYGNGQVVYLGFNETWRLRRKYGEKYYRRFWSQLIYQLGMSHVLGDSKRFVPQLDRQQYRAEEKVTFTVEASDENYEPLSEEQVPERVLAAELIAPDPAGGAPIVRELPVPLLRSGVFETRFPVFTPGSYTIRVRDPITNKYEERRFEVTSLSAERRRSVRDVQLQTDLAQRTGGRTYDLVSATKLIDDLRAEPTRETVTRNHALWHTPLWFGLIILLMLSEWLVRKWIRLT
ncbi:MAG: hypothetical protein ACKOUR_17955 [Planctomycetota bacterium]